MYYGANVLIPGHICRPWQNWVNRLNPILLVENPQLSNNTGCSIVNDINQMVIVQAIWMLMRSGWSYFFTDIGTFWNISFKKKNTDLVFPIDNVFEILKYMLVCKNTLENSEILALIFVLLPCFTFEDSRADFLHGTR